MRFAKPAISIPDQITLLRQRGMSVTDEAAARHYLTHISYYRLRAYWLPFEAPAADGTHALTPGTRFEDVLALYVFDRQLRLLIMDAVERVEVAIRAHWAHHLAMTHGAHGYQEAKHYRGNYRRGEKRVRHDHAKALADLEREFDRSNDVFAEHYRRKYNNPALPPVWMAAEVMSFGLLSKFYSGLKHRADRQEIARPLGLDEKVLTSFAHHMSHVRNICAHHGRLWNRRFTIRMMEPRYPAQLPVAMRGADPRHLHNTLVMLDHLMRIIAPESGWRERLIDHLRGCPLPDAGNMGFPEDWQARPVWRMQA